jgi:hypothetical protein
MTANRDPAAADVQALAEAVADVLVARGLAVAPSGSAIRVVSASQLAELLKRDRRWIYQHAHELGGFRYGDGPKARLGFDLAAVEQWKRARTSAFSGSVQPHRRRGSTGLLNATQQRALIPFDD